MKKMSVLLIFAIMLLSFSSCSVKGGKVQDSTETQRDIEGNEGDNHIDQSINMHLDEELSVAKAVKLELPKEADSLLDFASAMERVRDQGLEFLSYGMTRQAAYCFSFAGGSVSALRLASQQILGQEPVGFGDWDTVGAISFATPVPFICEAIVAEYSGDNERAQECREMAQLNFNEVIGTENLSVITTMEKSELETLINNLIEFEKHIYWYYPADPVPRERSGLEWSPEYHLNMAGAFEELGYTELATDCYLDALAQDPFNADLFALCAKAMYSVGDINLMRTYIEEGLLMEPEHPLLNSLGAVLWCAAGNYELAQEHLTIAQAANSTDEEVVFICQAVENALKGEE